MTRIEARKDHLKSVLIPDAVLLPAVSLAIHPAARPAFEAWLIEQQHGTRAAGHDAGDFFRPHLSGDTGVLGPHRNHSLVAPLAVDYLAFAEVMPTGGWPVPK